jgi:transposase InsO family protein
MPFREVDLMESRRRLVHEVLVAGVSLVSLSEACRRAGVTRKTGRKWVARAREDGIERLAPRSRAPKRSPARTPPEVEGALLGLKDRYPEWGARKLVRLLEFERGIALPLRTAERVLSRHGRTAPPCAPPEAPTRFERESCGALLQMDFKGLPKGCPYALLTALDDHGRYCLHFGPVPDKTGASVRAALWELFGEHGLPKEMLMDNGDCWGSVLSKSPTAFEVWLMLLGVRPVHGRPGHPQTQGKVERFHRTAKIELGQALVQPTLEAARAAIEPFVDRYNWVRPHDALGGAVPGSRYAPFPRKRPERLPEHEIPEGALSRAVDGDGFLSYAGDLYRIGRGLAGQRVVLREDELGIRAFLQGFPLAYLHEL